MAFFIAFASLLAVATVVLLIYIQVRKKRLLKLIGAELDHFPELPLIGAAFSFLGKDCAGVTETVDRLLNSVKLPVYTWIGPFQLFIIIDNPEDLEILLSDPNALGKPYIYKFFKKDRGLVAADANIWKVHRKILSPSFSINMIKTLIPTFHSKVEKMINKLKMEKEGDDINLLEHFYICAVDMISGKLGNLNNLQARHGVYQMLLPSTAATTEVDIDIDDEKNREYVRAVIAGADLIAYRMIQAQYHIEWIYRWSKLYKIEQAAFGIADEFLARIIKMKKDLFDPDADAEEEKREELAKLQNKEFEQKPKTVINQLFRFWAKGVIGYKDVRDELDVMLYTGSDTSTHLASYTILMLAMHQDVQQKVVNELRSIFVDKSVPVDYDSMKQLTYLEMVIKETLRLYPVIPYIGRKTTQDIKLKNLTVPSGTMIGIPIMRNNRDPVAFGPNPNLFDPDNFLPEKVAKRHPYQYMPFSCGPRNCIGMIYGLYSVRTIVATMLMNFKVSTSLRFEDIKLVYNIALRITNENLVKLEHRHDFWLEN